MPEQSKKISQISENNASFWDELCGTQLASSLGITDNSEASLKKFDDWYFDFYPYLYDHIPFSEMAGKNVLEVGLGYGTVSQKIAESGAIYQGLDIAAGPVEMAKLRIKQKSLIGDAQQGSILSAPFDDATFDYVVAIGCLHHTGDLRKAVDECRRLLKPGGKLIFMVYYAYSYRRFVQAPLMTFNYWVRESLGYRGVVGANLSYERASYDTNKKGEAAPHTDWISSTSLRSYCSNFTAYADRKENIDNGTPFKLSGSRETLLKTRYPAWVGLDLYATATK